MRVNLENKESKKSPLVYYKNPFYYLLALFLIAIGITYFTKYSSFIILVFAILILIIILRVNSCKKCHRLFPFRNWKKEHVSTEIKPHHYTIETKYLYSNGEYHNSKYENKTRDERIEKYSDTACCKYCGNKKVKITYVHLDKSTRPKTIEYVKTSVKSPRVCVIEGCNNRLRSRRKYCSKCRPSGRATPYEDDENYYSPSRRNNRSSGLPPEFKMFGNFIRKNFTPR